MVLPTFFKRRTSRHTSKRRQKLSTNSKPYESLEPRNLLATFVVTHADDVVADDGLLSLREAVIAANTNEAFSDAPAGDEEGDRIVFEAGEPGADPSDIQLLTLGELEITDDLVIVGTANGLSQWTQIESGFTSRIFNVNTTEPVHFRRLAIVTGMAETGGNIVVQPGGDLSIVDSYVGGGEADLGGAIVVDSASLFAYQTFFQQNAAGSGGAIHAVNSELRFNRSSFLGNTATAIGGGINSVGGTLAAYSTVFGETDGSLGNNAVTGGAVALSGNATFVSNAEFYGNTAFRSGGAIHSEGSSTLRVFGGSFIGNGLEEGSSGVGGAALDGGAIAANGEQAFIANAEFRENRAGRGGAIFSSVEGAVLRNLEVDGNFAAVAGGGLYLFDTSYISDSEVVNNSAVSSTLAYGGGIRQSSVDGSTVVLRRVRVDNNEATTGGGGISVAPRDGFPEDRFHGTLRVFNSSVSNNVVDRAGGGISINGGDLLLTAATIAGNSATGVFGDGGGIHSSSGTVLAFDSTIESNSASRFGGGQFLIDGFARFANVNLNENVADVNGGGAYVRGDGTRLVFIDGEVLSNEAVADSEFSDQAFGGAVSAGLGTQLYALGTLFSENRGGLSAGAIFSTGLVNVQNATFSSNQAENGGAIFIGEEGRAYITNSNFSLNSTTRNGSAVFAESDTILVLTDSVFSGNEVTEGSSGHVVHATQDGFTRFNGNTYLNNTPINRPLLDPLE